jgi:hypothetical protein
MKMILLGSRVRLKHYPHWEGVVKNRERYNQTFLDAIFDRYYYNVEWASGEIGYNIEGKDLIFIPFPSYAID